MDAAKDARDGRSDVQRRIADVDAAVLQLLEQGETITPDLGGSSTTEGVGDAIAELVSR